MRVHIDDCFEVECSDILPERWNGWACPLFTRDQLDEVRDAVLGGGFDLTDMDGLTVPNAKTLDMTTLDYVNKWGNLYEVAGWIWQVVEEGK